MAGAPARWLPELSPDESMISVYSIVRTSRPEIRLALAAGHGPGECTVARPGPAWLRYFPAAWRAQCAFARAIGVRMDWWCESALSGLYLVGWLAGLHQDQAHLSAFQVVTDPAKTGCQNLTSAS
jgi:hypothetical protein